MKARCHFDPFGKAQGELREKSLLVPTNRLQQTGIDRWLILQNTSLGTIL
jgi:hypothetical protein